MIHYSFYTMLMAVLSCNFIIILTALCFYNKEPLLSIDYKVFTLLLGIAIMRLIIPVGFSSDSAIVLPDSLSLAAGSPNASRWWILGFVWVAGSIFCLVKIIRERIILKRTVYHFHRSILIQAGVDLLTIISWWNPACYVLQGQISVVTKMLTQFDSQTPDDLTESLFIMGEEPKPYEKISYIAVLAVAIAFYLLSYCFEV